MSFSPLNLGKPNLILLMRLKMYFWESIKVLHDFLKWEALGGCSKYFYVNPHQAIQHFNSLEKGDE